MKRSEDIVPAVVTLGIWLVLIVLVFAILFVDGPASQNEICAEKGGIPVGGANGYIEDCRFHGDN